MNKSKVLRDIEVLEFAVKSTHALAKQEGRPLDQSEIKRIQMLEKDIAEYRLQLPDGPLTLDRTMFGQHDTTITPTPARGKDYRSMFGHEKGKTLDTGGFKSFNDFLAVVTSGRSDDRLKLAIQASMGESIPSSGGFSVPEEFAAWLLDASLETEIIRPRATVWPMKSETLKVPGWDSGSHTSTLFGGLVGTWLGESDAATEVYAKLRQIELSTKKLACYTAASNELVADGITFEQQLNAALVKTISWYLDYAFISGTGAGQPQGILKSPALITVSAESGQHVSILYENITKMYARLAPQCMGNAIWIASQTCIPDMLTLSISIGTGGSVVPAMKESNGQFSLLGKPVIFTEKVPALGSLGDLILCDPSQFTVGLRSAVSFDKSIHVGWLKDEASYRCIIRVDGQGMWDKAITPKNGSTLSWCVALGARS